MAHLKYEILINYLEGRLSAEDRNAAVMHLDGPCKSCQRRLALLQTVLRVTATDQTAAPSASILKRAIDIPLTHRANSKPDVWRRLVATLAFDSHLQPSLAATRGVSRERQMLFTAEQVDIDLQIKPAHEGHDLIGQVLEEQAPGFISAFVSLQGNTGQPQMAREADSKGQFVFRGISPGVYDLMVDLENREIAVTGLEFRDE
jgi:hypothetical protein